MSNEIPVLSFELYLKDTNIYIAINIYVGGCVVQVISIFILLITRYYIV